MDINSKSQLLLFFQPFENNIEGGATAKNQGERKS